MTQCPIDALSPGARAIVASMFSAIGGIRLIGTTGMLPCEISP